MARLLTGTLFLPDGSPLANATIYLTSKRNEIAGILKGLDGAFTTNSGGQYTQSVHEGFYQVSVSHPLAGNSSRRWNLGNIQVNAGAATSINELLQFSEDAQNPVANEIQQMYEQIVAARDAAQLSATAAGTSATAASASATSAGGSATAAAGAATTAMTKAGEATTAATTATSAATTATAKAGEATAAAGTATGAATTAATKAGEASASAAAAAGSASSAAASAASVDGVVTAAQSARDDAIAAKNASQGAAGDSIAAAELASEAAGTATTKAGEAIAAAGTATGAATTAITKASEASASATAAAGSASDAAASAASVDGVVTAAQSARDDAIEAVNSILAHTQIISSDLGVTQLSGDLNCIYTEFNKTVSVSGFFNLTTPFDGSPGSFNFCINKAPSTLMKLVPLGGRPAVFTAVRGSDLCNVVITPGSTAGNVDVKVYPLLDNMAGAFFGGTSGLYTFNGSYQAQ